MNPKTTALLALVACGLGAFVYFYEIEGEGTRQAARDAANEVHVGIDPEAIESITLESLDGVGARFERRDGRWEIVTPVLAPADGNALDAIANALAHLPKEGIVDAVPNQEDALEAFGLGDGTRIIRFEVAGETRGLRIGRETPVGGHRYVARLADDEVAYVERFRLNAFDRNLDDLRERQILDLETDDLETLRVAWTDESGSLAEVALAKDDAGEWQIGVPIVGRADPQVMRDLISDLVFLRAEGFIDSADALPADALATTTMSFHWTRKGQHLEERLRIAGSIEESLVVEGPGGQRYRIASERLEDFPRRLVDYRYKQLSSYDVSAARRLELEFHSEALASSSVSPTRVVVELEDTGWRSDGPPVDPDRVSDLIRALAHFRAADILADELGEAERSALGLAPPRARIRVEGTRDSDGQTEVLADLVFGRIDRERGLLVGQRGEPVVYTLPPSDGEAIPASLERFEADFVASDEEASGSEREAALPANHP